MGDAARLRLVDVQAVFRLLGEVRELSREPRLWRRHALTGLMRLTGARVGIAALEPRQISGTGADLVERVEVGWESLRQQRILADFVAGGHILRHPGYAYLRRREGCSFTRLRREMVDDAAWYGSDVARDFHQAIGCDDLIHSRRMVAGLGWSDSIILHRRWAESPFAHRARGLVRLFHDELARLWRQPHELPLPGDGSAWPRHLCRLVSQFRCGHSEKEAAAALGLSPHTIHAYVKELYRRLGVKSRGEAMVALAPADGFVPRMTDGLPTSR